MQRWRHAQRRQKQKPQRIVGFRDIKERMSNNWSSGLIATGSWNACCTCLAVSQRLHMCFASFWMTGKLVRCRSIVCIARDEEILTRERVRNYYYGQRGNLLSREMLIWFWWMCWLSLIILGCAKHFAPFALNLWLSSWGLRLLGFRLCFIHLPINHSFHLFGNVWCLQR